MRVVALLFLTLLTACGNDALFMKSSRLQKLHGHPLQQTNTYEGTPVVFNGQQVNFEFLRDAHLVRVWDIETGSLINQFAWDYGFGAAFVDSQVYIFGSDDSGQVIVERHSSDLVSWSADTVVMTASAGQRFFNVSVAHGQTGYVLAYEVRETANGIGDSFRMAVSTDLHNWNTIGDVFDHAYSACPVVRYVNGYYYVIYLVNEKNMFLSRIARSQDLITWEKSTEYVLEPDPGEGINTSDVDLYEWNGETMIYYYIGDQATWGGLGIAKFSGSMKDFFEGYFK